MRRHLGIPLLALLAGCATQPTGISPDSPTAGLTAPVPPGGLLAARVGVEYLADRTPDVIEVAATPWATFEPRARTREGGEPQRATVMTESLRGGAAVPRASQSDDSEPTELPWLSKEALQSIENPVERVTLSYLNELLGEDRRRLTREVGAPILFQHMRWTTSIHGMESELDRIDLEDQALLLSRERGALFNRPIRRALRESTWARNFQEFIDAFKADNVPLTGPYEEQRSRRKYGRFSMRVRPLDSDNPVEIAYRLHGWKVGTATERMKVSYDQRLSDKVYISLRSNYTYDTDMIDLWGDLHYAASEDTHVHLLVGDRMDIVTGSTMYPVVNSPFAMRAVDESPGMMFYVEHIF